MSTTTVQYLTVAEAAARLGMSAASVSHLCKSGQLTGAYRLHPRQWVIPEETVEAWQVRPVGWPKGKARPSRCSLWLDAHLLTVTTSAMRDSVQRSRQMFGDPAAYRYWSWDCPSCAQQSRGMCDRCSEIDRAMENEDE